jgi:molecular chaperone DnaK
MVKDAEEHAEDDKKMHELIQARNQADQLIHLTETSLKESADNVSDADKQKVESAIETLQTAIKGDDKDEIIRCTQVLQEASTEMMKSATADSSAQEPASDGTTSNANDDVLDAEFEEVDDSK